MFMFAGNVQSPKGIIKMRPFQTRSSPKDFWTHLHYEFRLHTCKSDRLEFKFSWEILFPLPPLVSMSKHTSSLNCLRNQLLESHSVCLSFLSLWISIYLSTYLLYLYLSWSLDLWIFLSLPLCFSGTLTNIHLTIKSILYMIKHSVFLLKLSKIHSGAVFSL